MTLRNPASKEKTGRPEEDDNAPTCERDLRKALSLALKLCGKSREIVAEELSLLVDRDITVAILNDYTAQKKMTARFPAAYIPALCQVTGDDGPLRCLLTPKLRRLLRIGECELAAQFQTLEKRKIIAPLLNESEGAESK